MIDCHCAEVPRDAFARLHQTAAGAGIADSDWRAVVIDGGAVPQILEQEKEQGADLVVLGKHGMGMAEELSLGSVTKHALAPARSDVLIACR